MSENDFLPKIEKPLELKEIKPFIRPVKLEKDFVCVCGKNCQAGEEVFKVLTKGDIERISKNYSDIIEELKEEDLMQEMCKECMDKKIYEESLDREKRNEGV